MLFVHALGTAQIDFGHRRIAPTAARKFAFLLRICANAGQRISRIELQELMFPCIAESNARHSLRDLIYQVRQAGVRIESEVDGITVDRRDVQTDVDVLIRASRPTIDQMRAAQGGLLPGYGPDHSEAFAEWLSAYRADVGRRACQTLAREMARAKAVSDWATTERAARACLGLEPMHEEATLTLAEALAVNGLKSQAVRLLETYVDDLGPERSHLHVPAAIVRRRISEPLGERFRAPLTLPFLGRDSEILAVHERFERARCGESQCVVLFGEAGIGKSRLADEFCTQAVLAGARVEHATTQPHDKHRPMGAFTDLVPRLLNLPGALGCSPESMALLQRLTRHTESETPATVVTAQSEATASAIARALSELVDSIATEATLVLLIDDAQWIDDRSRDTIALLAAAKQPRPLMIILTSRDRNTGQYYAQRTERMLGVSLTPIALAPLTEMVARVFENHIASTDHELHEWLVHTSGGNPFFLRSLVSHFQTSGERFVVPDTLGALLDQQLAALSDTTAAVFTMCVALGRHSNLGNLEAALELPYIQLQMSLRELDSANLICQVDDRIEPAHWLVAEAAGRATSALATRLLNRRVATILEQKARESHSATQLWDCAEHWNLAGEHERASIVMRECANHSLEMGRPREAAEVLLRAAATLAGAERAELAKRAIQVADSADESDVVLRGAEFGRSIDPSFDYPGLKLAEVVARMCVLGETERGVDELRRWLGGDQPIELRLRAAISLLILADQESNPELGDEAFQGIGDELIPEKSQADATRLTALLIYHSRFGDVKTSLAVADQLRQLAGSLNAVDSAMALRKVGVAFLRAGRHDEGIAILHTSYGQAEAIGLSRLQVYVAGLIAGAYFDVCHDSKSSEWLSLANRLATEHDSFRNSQAHVSLNAEMVCTLGDARAARQWLEIGFGKHAKAPTATSRRWLRMLRAWTTLLERTPYDADEIVRGMTQHHRPRNETPDLGDIETAVAATGLAQAGRTEDARAVITRYATVHRRGQGLFARALRQVAEEIGW